VSRSLPPSSSSISSAYPMGFIASCFIVDNNESMTRFHPVGEIIPPWGQPLPGLMVLFTPLRSAVTLPLPIE